MSPTLSWSAAWSLVHVYCSDSLEMGPSHAGLHLGANQLPKDHKDYICSRFFFSLAVYSVFHFPAAAGAVCLLWTQAIGKVLTDPSICSCIFQFSEPFALPPAPQCLLPPYLTPWSSVAASLPCSKGGVLKHLPTSSWISLLHFKRQDVDSCWLTSGTSHLLSYIPKCLTQVA